VTEAVSGLDLVHLMIAIAGNNRLDVTQERVSQHDSSCFSHEPSSSLWHSFLLVLSYSLLETQCWCRVE
jgi:biotin carboxylase